MNEPFHVSVITPVYNAERFLRTSVESALSISCVSEVILIDDAGPDNSLEVCRQLEQQFDRVKLLRHEGGANRGAGASRNLGIQHAKSPYIAFLDADDWYLPERFEEDRKILTRDSSIDGVYNALGNHYESPELRQMWLDQNRPEILTLSEPVPPEALILVLLHAHPTVFGEFSTDTITVRKEFFDRVGLFHTELRLQQDTNLWKRMAAFGRLAAGNIEHPVAIRRVHPENRMTRTNDHYKYLDLWWSDLGSRFRRGGVSRSVMEAWRKGHIDYQIERGRKLRAAYDLAWLLLLHPAEFRIRYGFVDQAIRKLAGSGSLVNRLLSAKNRVFARA